MNIFFKRLILTLSLLFSFSIESKEVDFEINIPFSIDCRTFTKGQVGEDQLVRCAEYFLDGENRQNWTELVSTQYFVSRFNFSLEDFFQKAVKEIAKNLPKNRIQSRIIKSDKENLLAEWWIKEKTFCDQHEWVKIIRKEHHIGIVRYTLKNLREESKRGSLWLQILSKTTLDQKK